MCAQEKQKIPVHRYALGITPKRATSGEAHPRGLAPAHTETSQRWRAVGNTVSALTGPEIEP